MTTSTRAIATVALLDLRCLHAIYDLADTYGLPIASIWAGTLDTDASVMVGSDEGVTRWASVLGSDVTITQGEAEIAGVAFVETIGYVGGDWVTRVTHNRRATDAEIVAWST